MNIVRTEDASEMLKVPFSELGDLFLCGVLITKAGLTENTDEVSATLGLVDLFASQAIDEAKRNRVTTVSVGIDNPLTTMMKTAFSALFGNDESIASSGFKQEPIGSYYSGRIENWLRILRDGDSIVTSTIEEFSRIDTDEIGVGIYKVRFRTSKLLTGFKANLVDYVYFHEEAYKKLLGATDMSTPAIAVGKQLDFLRASLQTRSTTTGETRFSFSLKSFNFRRSIIEFGGVGGQAMMLAPLSPNVGVKMALPFLLNVKGELDLEQVKIITPIHAIDDVDVQYSIQRPAVANVFGATYCALSPEVRMRLSPGEVQVYEKVVSSLQENLCFLKRPDLEEQFTQFAVWAVKSVFYCLEEPTFLKEQAERWAENHRDDSYQRMEDDFFLPFVYERLRDKFGAIVSKKPERFGGNVDILFGEIPVELKVRKGPRDALVDGVVDEKYKPTGQAAAYAALTRLGCVLVLDIPTGTPVVTNLSACIKVVRRDFAEAEHPTSVVVFVFHCNSPRPSSAN